MIYQFDCHGRMVASHVSTRAAAEWIQKCTPYDVAKTTQGVEDAALYIIHCCHINDEMQALRWQAYGYYWSTYSFLGDL